MSAPAGTPLLPRPGKTVNGAASYLYEERMWMEDYVRYLHHLQTTTSPVQPPPVYLQRMDFDYFTLDFNARFAGTVIRGVGPRPVRTIGGLRTWVYRNPVACGYLGVVPRPTTTGF